jgi:hypothetical protein
VTFPLVAASYSINLSTILFIPTCSITPDNGPPACVSGNIVEANFGLSSSNAWFQVSGSDLRNDRGITNMISAPASSICGNVTIRDGINGIPGIIFTGSGTTDFGEGKASSKNWIVSGANTSYAGTRLLTAHDAVLETLERNAVTPTSLSTYCSPANCTLTDAIPSGAYRVQNADLTLAASTLTTKRVVIIVDGDLTLNGTIQVAPGAYLMFVVKGDITIAPSVGTATYTCAGSGTTQLQGVFSTDGNFMLQGGSTCPTPDQQLNLAGTIITNAARQTSGTLVNNRTLCSTNNQFPSFTISPRFDFSLNIPNYLRRPSLTWQEVAP